MTANTGQSHTRSVLVAGACSASFMVLCTWVGVNVSRGRSVVHTEHVKDARVGRILAHLLQVFVALCSWVGVNESRGRSASQTEHVKHAARFGPMAQSKRSRCKCAHPRNGRNTHSEPKRRSVLKMKRHGGGEAGEEGGGEWRRGDWFPTG